MADRFYAAGQGLHTCLQNGGGSNHHSDLKARAGVRHRRTCRMMADISYNPDEA